MLMFGGLIFVSGLTAGIATSIATTVQSNNFSSLNHFKQLSAGTVSDAQIRDDTDWQMILHEYDLSDFSQ